MPGRPATFLVASVGLGVVAAGLLVVQANLLAYAISAVFHDGAARRDLGPALAGLAVVVRGPGRPWCGPRRRPRTAAPPRCGVSCAGGCWPTRPGSDRRRTSTTAELTTLATRGLDALDAYFARYLPQVLLAALVPLAVLVAVLPADALAGVTIAVTLPLIPVFMGLVGRATEVHSRRQFAQLGRLTHHLLELVTGLPTLKAFGRATVPGGVVAALSADQRRLTMRTLRLAFLSSLVLELLATVSVALVAVGIGLRLVGGSLDLRTALLVLILAPEAYAPAAPARRPLPRQRGGAGRGRGRCSPLWTRPCRAPGYGGAARRSAVSGRGHGRLRRASGAGAGPVLADRGAGRGGRPDRAERLGQVHRAEPAARVRRPQTSGAVRVGGVVTVRCGPRPRGGRGWPGCRSGRTCSPAPWPRNIALGRPGRAGPGGAGGGPAGAGRGAVAGRRSAIRRYGHLGRRTATGRAGPGLPARRPDRAARRADREPGRRDRGGDPRRGTAAGGRPDRAAGRAPAGAAGPGRPGGRTPAGRRSRTAGPARRSTWKRCRT